MVLNKSDEYKIILAKSEEGELSIKGDFPKNSEEIEISYWDGLHWTENSPSSWNIRDEKEKSFIEAFKKLDEQWLVDCDENEEIFFKGQKFYLREAKKNGKRI